MNSRHSYLILLKNLIENKEYNQAYSIKKECKWVNIKVFYHLSRFNFGSALLEIENDLFNELKDDDFKESMKKKTDDRVLGLKLKSFDRINYDREYFDAMTDGQMGEYDEFRAGGGNLDDIDTWSRG